MNKCACVRLSNELVHVFQGALFVFLHGLFPEVFVFVLSVSVCGSIVYTLPASAFIDP